jgi:hypothetical protein
MSLYELLKIDRRASTVCKAWVARMRELDPNEPPAQGERALTLVSDPGEYEAVIQAGWVLTDAQSRERYDELGHDRYSSEVGLPAVVEEPWQAVIVRKAVELHAGSRDPSSVSAWLEEIVGAYPKAQQPTFLAPEPMWEVPGLALYTMAGKLLNECEEFELLKVGDVEFLWKLKAPESRGHLTLGKCQKIPALERASRWKPGGSGQVFRIWLALPDWIAMPEDERWAILHHELMHCGVERDGDGNRTFYSRKHDVEVMQKTLERFGGWESSRRAAVAAANRHPETAPRTRLDGLQLGLFSTPLYARYDHIEPAEPVAAAK